MSNVLSWSQVIDVECEGVVSNASLLSDSKGQVFRRPIIAVCLVMPVYVEVDCVVEVTKDQGTVQVFFHLAPLVSNGITREDEFSCVDDDFIRRFRVLNMIECHFCRFNELVR